MQARAKLAKDKGCDAIDWDNVDGYANDSGFPIAAEDQLAYNMMLAEVAHSLDMAVGLKNDLGQVPDLVSHFDFAVNEQCQQYGECDSLMPFIKAGKPVWAINYSGLTETTQCAEANRRGFMMLLKHDNLDAAGYQCWQLRPAPVPAPSTSTSRAADTSVARRSTTLATAVAVATTTAIVAGRTAGRPSRPATTSPRTSSSAVKQGPGASTSSAARTQPTPPGRTVTVKAVADTGRASPTGRVGRPRRTG